MNLHHVCVKLEHSSVQTIQVIQKAIAMGYWWLAASSRPHARSCISSHVEFFGKTSNHPGDSAPLQPSFGALRFLAFPKSKITFEGEEMSDCRWDSGSWWRLGELYEVLRCLHWRGLMCHCPMYNVSCILYLLQQMSLVFNSTRLDTFWTYLLFPQEVEFNWAKELQL